MLIVSLSDEKISLWFLSIAPLDLLFDITGAWWRWSISLTSFRQTSSTLTLVDVILSQTSFCPSSIDVKKRLFFVLDLSIMEYRHEDQQRRQQLLTVVDRGNAEQLFVSAFWRCREHQSKQMLFIEGISTSLSSTTVSKSSWSNGVRRCYRRSDRFHRLYGNQISRYTIDHRCRQRYWTGCRKGIDMEHDWLVGSYEKTKILLVHGANPNKQCATGYVRWSVVENRFLHCVLLQGYGLESRCSSTEVSHRWSTSSISCQSEHFQSIGQNSASSSGCFLHWWECESDTGSVSSKSTRITAIPSMSDSWQDEGLNNETINQSSSFDVG